MAINLANLSYLHAAGDGGPRRTTQVVVIHATDNTASAEAEAGYATRRTDGTSAHFYVDAVKPYRGLPLDNIAYGCLWHGNQISVQLELCGRSNQLADATLRAAAPIVAAVCAQYGVPARKITAAQVAAGVKGICGHADITAAFPQDGGDHTDPGASFPWDRFISYVTGTAAPGGEEFMATASDIITAWSGGFDHTPDGTKLEPVRWRVRDEQWQAQVTASLAASAVREQASMAAIDALAKAVVAGGGSVDVAAIKAEILDVETRMKATVDGHFRQLAAAHQAAADVLDS